MGQVRTLVACSLSIAALLASSGCLDQAAEDVSANYSSLATMHGTSSQLAPPMTISWPASVPSLGMGSLVLATADGFGSATALWETHHSVRDVLANYDAHLLQRGFQRDPAPVVAGYLVRDYTDARHSVRAVASRVGGITSVTVTVAPL